MNQLDTINRIISLLSRFVTEVKGFNAINQYGINLISENILIPIFQEVFGYRHLVNLNREKINYAGIDLGDKVNKVAFQITATSNNAKVKHTLNQFVKNNYYKDYNTLFIYIITEKEDSYSEREYHEIIQGKFKFSAKDNILDNRDLIRLINSLSDYKILKHIEELLEQQFSDQKLTSYKESFSDLSHEIVTTNLLEIKFPEKLYVGKLNLDRKEILKGIRRKKVNDREVIYYYKNQKGLRFSADWIDYEKHIYTFHDLWNTNHDLSKIVDVGSVDVIRPEEFYEQDQNCLRAFKALLKFCFSKQAYFWGIDFYHDDKVYVFVPEDENIITRTETWNTGKRNTSREVIRVKLHKKDYTPWYYTNLAFSIIFRFYDNKWYIEISPEWYITFDGKQKHYWEHEDVSSYLKRVEKNQHVLNHIRFIGNYLKFGRTQIELFKEDVKRPKNFIEFLHFLKFNNAPNLLEENWTNNEQEDELKAMKDIDGLLEFDV